jgi:hypothetical protein
VLTAPRLRSEPRTPPATTSVHRSCALTWMTRMTQVLRDNPRKSGGERERAAEIPRFPPRKRRPRRCPCHLCRLCHKRGFLALLSHSVCHGGRHGYSLSTGCIRVTQVPLPRVEEVLPQASAIPICVNPQCFPLTLNPVFLQHCREILRCSAPWLMVALAPPLTLMRLGASSSCASSRQSASVNTVSLLLLCPQMRRIAAMSLSR